MKDLQETLCSTTQILEPKTESEAPVTSKTAKPLGDHISASKPPTSNEKARTGLNWGRIWKYAALMVVGSFVVGFIFGAIRGIMTVTRLAIPAWIEPAQGMTMTIVTGFIFARLSYKQHERTVLSVLIVALIGVLITFLSTPLFGMPIGQAIAASAYVLVLSMICVPIGLNMRVHKETAQLKVPRLVHKGHNSVIR